MFSKTFIILSTLALSALAQPEEPHPAPEPYSFTFESPNEDGSSSARSETGDANGRITGFYIIKGADGQDRRVDYYYADETGFHAEISTNEIGTISHEASDAIYKSSSPSIAELAASWESSESGRSAASRRGQELSSGRASSIRTSSILTETRQAAPVRVLAPPPQAAPVQTTPEGFVLVRASAARTAGLSGIGPEITNFQNLQGLQAGGARPFGGARPGRK